MLEENITQDNNEISDVETNTKNSGNLSNIRAVFDYVEIFAICICIVFLIFSFAARICTVEGNSMKNTLNDREALVVSRLFYEPKQGDIVVFHQTHDEIDAYNKPIVKRVIALEGQTVKIDFAKGEVYVDGSLFNEEYVYLDTGSYERLYWADYGNMNYITSVFETVVPEGEVFVMGDNRNHSIDSRKNDIGTVDERRILGRVIFKLSPFGAVE